MQMLQRNTQSPSSGFKYVVPVVLKDIGSSDAQSERLEERYFPSARLHGVTVERLSRLAWR
jgi:hypothetical protein